MNKDVDINEELEELIIQYGIDRYHPRFSKWKDARLLIQEFMNQYKEKKIIMVAASLTDSNYIMEQCCSNHLSNDIVLYEQIDDYPWNEADMDSMIVVISFYGRREAVSRLHKRGITALSIYDYLAERGLLLEGNYYDIFGEEYHVFSEGSATFDYGELDMNAIFFYDRRCYEINEENLAKEMYLARMIFDCVYVKDWELVEKYIKTYVQSGFSFAKRYEKFAEKVKELIDSIKESLAARQKDDIVIFWLDQLEYSEDKDMPYLRSLAEKSVDFVNAYTVTPNTTPTAKTLFAKMNAVDDRAYKIRLNKESSFIYNIEEQGFCFRFYTFLSEVDNDVKGRICQNRCTTFSAICWDMISDMLKGTEKFCAVLHEIYSTHNPYISFGLLGEKYSCDIPEAGFLKDYKITERNRQVLESRKYIDNVLKQYCAFLPDNVYKIFMSDHGHTALDRFHTIFRIVQKDVAPQRIEGIFSYINFDKVIYKMLNSETDYSEITDEYAKIQDVPRYNKKALKKYFTNHELLSKYDPSFWGWKGIITRQHTYIRYDDGKERYYNNSYDGDILTEGKVQYLRDLCTPFPQDIIYDDKFRYSCNAYHTLHNYVKRNGERDIEKAQVIKDLFAKYSKSEHIALRGGGEHTLQLWYTLKEEQQEKISCIIDSDKKCAAARLGLKIIDVNEVYQEKIDAIIISSYQKELEWYDELRKVVADIPIIRLYDYLKERGMACKREFYKREYKEEDLVWKE